MTLTDLNETCAAHARELTDKWKFTGWKPAQGNYRLHAQWIRCDEHEGDKYYSCLQCWPLEFENTINVLDGLLDEAKESMSLSLDGVALFTKLAPEPIPYRRPTP